MSVITVEGKYGKLRLDSDVDLLTFAIESGFDIVGDFDGLTCDLVSLHKLIDGILEAKVTP